MTKVPNANGFASQWNIGFYIKRLNIWIRTKGTHLLMLMCIYSKHDNVHYVGECPTCSANKFTCKTEYKLGTKYVNSPFYRGPKLWNKLTREVQCSEIYGVLIANCKNCIKVLKL